MKSLGPFLLLFAATLAGQANAVMYCCRPGCAACNHEECGGYNVCTNVFFNTCCADEKKAIMFEDEVEYFRAVAAGEVKCDKMYTVSLSFAMQKTIQLM
ncbi:hypothetical protein VPNG_03508 [Cytospora leucostoma]|uniref:SMB domain-containing protein n=1 Tax=Cytospora leucostoma TaxID=1230097 RepID=A0A423XCP3_9PEZI|nr:hypothetical protein VPNG_03508 [Cytospora leucostoma]